MKALNKAVELAGGQAALARLLTEKRNKDANGDPVNPVTRQNVQYWMKVNLPPKIAVDIETVLAARVTRYELLPELFGPSLNDMPVYGSSK